MTVPTEIKHTKSKKYTLNISLRDGKAHSTKFDWKQLNMGNTVGNVKIEENVHLKQVANCDKAIKLLDHGSISYNQVESMEV